MRLVSFTESGASSVASGTVQRSRPDDQADRELSATTAVRLGLLVGERSIIDLAAAARLVDGAAPPWFGSLLAMLDAGQQALDDAQRVGDWVAQHQPEAAIRSRAEVRLLAPLPRPRSIRDCLAFQRHLEGCGQTVLRRKFRPLAALDRWVTRLRGASLSVPSVWFKRPVYYKGNPASVVGPESDIVWPAYTQQLDFELELAVVIGRSGRDIPAEQALEHVAGFTIFNDFSARDVQLEEMRGRLGPAKGKDFDTGNVLGPALVTRDEIPDAMNLAMVARVNGETWCRANSGEMHFSLAEIIAYVSQSETLYPGDVIGSGTAPGGCGMEHDRWIQPGDCVELEIEGLGILRNHIVRA